MKYAIKNTFVILSMFVCCTATAMEDNNIKPTVVEGKLDQLTDFYTHTSIEKLNSFLDPLRIPGHLHKAFQNISEEIIRSKILEFVQNLNKGNRREALNQLSTIKPGLSQFTIAYALRGKVPQNSLDFESYSVPDEIPDIDQFTNNDFNQALDVFVKKVINEVIRQYNEAQKSQVRVAFKQMDEQETTQLINQGYFFKDGTYLDTTRARLVPLSSGGAYTQGLWMLKVKGDSGNWSNRLIIKEVAASNAKAELNALSIVASDPVISAISMGVKNLKQLKKLDRDNSGVIKRSRRIQHLKNNSSWVPGFLPKLTFDVTQYKIIDPVGKHYLSVLGLAKGKSLYDYFKGAVRAAGNVSSEEMRYQPPQSVQLFYKAMEDSGIAFAQFHQMTNKCMLFAGTNDQQCYLLSYAHGDGHFQNVFYDQRGEGGRGTVSWIDNATLALNVHPEISYSGPGGLADPLMDLKGESGGQWSAIREFAIERDEATKLLPIQGDIGYFYLRPMNWLAYGTEGISELMKIDRNKHMVEIFFTGVKVFLKAYISQYPKNEQSTIQDILYNQFTINTQKGSAFELVLGDENYKLPDNIHDFN